MKQVKSFLDLYFFRVLSIGIRFKSAIFSGFVSGDPGLLKYSGFFVNNVPLEVENCDQASDVSKKGNDGKS